MNNPFEDLVVRLSLIENLILDLKRNSPKGEPSELSEQLFTIQQAADFLSLAVPTIYSMVSRGELPYMKRSKRLYFSRLELINYLKAGRKKTNAETIAEAGQYLINKKKGQPNE